MPKAEKLPSGSYRIRFTDPWGQRVPITKRTAADANAAYKKALADMARGEYVDPKKGRTTVGEWAKDWLAGARHLSPGSIDIYTDSINRITAEPIGKAPLGPLDAQTIDQYLTGRLAAGLAPSTVHRDYRTLHTMLEVAEERGVIARNPARHVRPPRIPVPDMTVLDAGQIDALADALTRPPGKRKRDQPVESRYRAWALVAAWGGLRWSELVGLRRARVDGAVIRVTEQLVRRRGGTWDRGPTKNRQSRTVTLPGFVADELAVHLDDFAAPDPDGLVFPTRTGAPMHGGSWSANVFGRALTRAALPTIRVHDLRHTAASLAIAAGAHPKEVQERLGHSSIRVTMDRYGHLFDAADADVAARLDHLHATGQRRLRAV